MIKRLMFDLYILTYCIASMIMFFVYIALLPLLAGFNVDEWGLRMDEMWEKMLNNMPDREDV